MAFKTIRDCHLKETGNEFTSEFLALFVDMDIYFINKDDFDSARYIYARDGSKTKKMPKRVYKLVEIRKNNTYLACEVKNDKELISRVMDAFYEEDSI